MTETRPLTDFPNNLDANQFAGEIAADGAITKTLESLYLVDYSNVVMVFSAPLDGSEVTALNLLISTHVPSQGGFPAYTPTPIEESSLTGTSEFVWKDANSANILTLNGNTILMDKVMEVPRIEANEVPGVSDANHSILYVNDTTGLLMQVEFGGASGPVGGGGGTSLQLANTGVGAHIYSTTSGNTGYFRGITGVNAHTIVTEGPSSVSIQVPFASISQTGAIRIASNTEVNAGLANNLAISPTGLAQWTLSANTIPRYQASATNAITNFTSTTYVVITGMTLTTPIAGTYMITFSASASASTNNNSLFVELFVGGTGIAASERESANNKPVVVATQAIAQVNGAQNIEARWRVNSNAASIAGPRTLSALRIGP